MGKYGASLIHEWFSDWHWVKCKRESYLCDVDRQWIETRNHKLKSIFDLKWKWAYESGLDNLTYSEKIVMDFFEQHGVAAYLIIINPVLEHPVFEIHRPRVNIQVTLSEEEFIEWIDNGLNPNLLPKPITKLHEVME